VAVLLTQRSVESGWVEKEWQSQVGVEASFRNVVILPLKDNECSIPALLRDKKYADFQGDYTEAIRQLIQAVKGHASCHPASSTRAMANERRQRLLQPKTSTHVLIIEDDLSHQMQNPPRNGTAL